MYTELINFINEILNDSRWGLGLWMLNLVFLFLATEKYKYSPIRQGSVAYFCAIMWATNVPVMAFLPIAILGYIIISVMLAVSEQSYLLATVLAIPAMFIFYASTLVILGGLFLLPDFIAEKIEAKKIESANSPDNSIS